MSYFTAENDVNEDGKAQNQTIWSLNSKDFLSKKQSFEFQHTVFSKTQELNEWAISFPVTSVLLFEKPGSLKERTEKLQICRREQKSQKNQIWLLVHHAQSHWWLIKTGQPNKKCRYTNYCYLRGLDSIAFCQRIFEITMKSTPHHAPSLPSFIQFINCEVNEILSFCLLMRMYLHV